MVKGHRDKGWIEIRNLQFSVNSVPPQLRSSGTAPFPATAGLINRRERLRHGSRRDWAAHAVSSGVVLSTFPRTLRAVNEGTLAASTFGASVLGKLSAPRRRTQLTMTLAFWAFGSRSAEAWLS
ncbi:uncharacterized protein CIMG_08208 [Coccidioides immitis RS]|uniref:Uncharacterized protein n=2 Tax=Coccidioides immitis TaxID=5501 RepID=A0A0E1RVZ5_COCIM|nr:uncharacterized protein CIMG_08208 [Coccidioides immitis RS]EAS29462.1 hypothetical protein CIMG_08208 [Coccidioides immitis RS]KMU84181.1 hypothetical protein CIHG_01967 [Coccidioides immitis H538.4]